MDTGALTRYLQGRLGLELEVVGARRAPFGMSREMWFVTCREPGGGERRLVFRRDNTLGGGSCPVTLRFEYELSRRLERTSIPVAKSLCFEDDAAWLIEGREFWLRDYVDGSPEVPGLNDPGPVYDDLRIAVSKEHARKMALVHALDWRGLGIDSLMTVPPSPETCARTAIDRLEAEFDAIRFEAFPLLTEALRWLRKHAPPSPVISLLKGSNGAYQEILRDGAIVGMSDWELASLGDPASDWARCAGFMPVIPGRWDERCLLDYYESLSGIHVSLERVAYYRVLYAAEMVLVCHNSALPLRRGATLLPGLAYLATSGMHGTLQRLAGLLGLAATA